MSDRELDWRLRDDFDLDIWEEEELSSTRRAPGKVTLSEQINVVRSPPSEARPVHSTMRSAAEASLGMSLGHVKVHQGARAERVVRKYDALALTVGSDIYLGGRVNNDLNPVMAHELAHVAQQQGAGVGMAAKRGEVEGPSAGAHEHEADAAAWAMILGRPARVTPTRMRIATFSPAAHRNATAQGLALGFTAEEIGMIYASNWERDFSQAVPEVGACAIAWKAVTNSAAKNHGVPGAAESNAFKAAADVLFNMPVAAFMKRFTEEGPQAKGESLSGYHSWEHMDRPDDEAVAEADQRWKGAANGLAGYLNDAIAYIKDEMMVAVQEYRRLKDLKEMNKKKLPDNWKGAKGKPKGYDPDKIKDAARGNSDTSQPQTAGGSAASRDPVAEEASNLAKGKGAKSVNMDEKEKEVWRIVGHHLGRSMHAFEDFWAHSNWVDQAQDLKRNKGKPPTRAEMAKELFTGDFTLHSQLHALGHKIKSMAASFLAGHSIMLKVYNRSKANASKWKPGGGKIKIGPLEVDPRWLRAGGFTIFDTLAASPGGKSVTRAKDDMNHAHGAVEDTIGGDSPDLSGVVEGAAKGASGRLENAGTGGLRGLLKDFDPEMAGTGRGNPELENLVKKTGKKVDALKKEAKSPDIHKAVELVNIFEDQQQQRAYGIYETADFLCSREWLTMLSTKADELIKAADEASDEKGHGKVAKDQHEHGKAHETAAAVAAAANKMVFGPLKSVMKEKNPDTALDKLKKQIALVDKLIAPPGPGHPLYGMITASGWAELRKGKGDNE
jgi:hypothetical protein